MDEGFLDVGNLYEGAPLGEPGGGLHYWGLWKMYKSRLWGWAALFTGPSWGT